jgi:hypothetical protein
VTHIYTAAAGYTITLRVRDDDYPYSIDERGEIGEAIVALQVTVNEAPAELINPLFPAPSFSDEDSS